MDTSGNISAGTTATATPSGKTALQTALTAANAAKNGTANSLYWVITVDLTTFETAITAAQTVYDNAAATQAAVDTAKTTLLDATTDYTGQKSVAETNPVTALTAIKNAYATGSGSGTLGTTASPTSVTIIVSGTITGTTGAGTIGWLDISGANAYPPIVLQGAAGGGTLNAAGLGTRVLWIDNGNKVTLGANLTLTGGSGAEGGGGVGVITGSTFTMTGGTISGNTAYGGSGGGVCVRGATFTMTGGTISGNTASHTGGGVFVDTTTNFTKTGGTIYGNTGGATANTASDSDSTGHHGHAVYWEKTGAKKKVDTDVTGNLSTTDDTTGWTAAQ